MGCRVDTYLDVANVALLVEDSGLETSRVNNVVNLLRGLFERLLGLPRGRVGTLVWIEHHMDDRMPIRQD